MKTLLKIGITSCYFLTLTHAQEVVSLHNNFKEYDLLFEKIAERRIGADTVMLNELKNPFIIVVEESINKDANQTLQEPLYALEAILNQKAKINGEWYKRNDQIGLFKLVTIYRDRVILQNEIEKKELVIRTKDERNIKIFTK
ncbi:hypothetical protein [Sulfurospirillum deleyianum]|uniref:Transformation system protein n=1 Tax=Sulfurospirillum deleyianum (strain ATCC 51133 / DSM 6946 / 5175) TaxID=525898 RepID=D1B1U0_SULD5|nr:hypothetical protein [Sulfurospirillum deleyianum]ACZ12060.1 hypothetical protein Sdel_1035 [Sulfurospirillum deleyianum DSM 6946]